MSTCLPEPWNDGEEYRGCRRPLESESKCCRGRTTGPEAPQLSAGFLPSRTRRDVRPLYIRNSILPLLANGTLWDPWHSKSIPRPEQDAEPLHLATEARRKPRSTMGGWRTALSIVHLSIFDSPSSISVALWLKRLDLEKRFAQAKTSTPNVLVKFVASLSANEHGRSRSESTA